MSVNTPELKDTAQNEKVARTRHLPKTTGEKWFGRIEFLTGEGFILALTAVIAYVAKYGKDSYGPVKNYLKIFQNWFEKILLTNKAFPLEEKGETGKLIAGAAASTMVLFHGGNFFAPIMDWLTRSKERIVTSINRKHGKPGEVEIGQERLKHEPKQTWGDIIKGRLVSWGIVFGSFLGADILAGTKEVVSVSGSIDKVRKFSYFEDKFGRWVAGFSKAGKEIAATPMNQALSAAQETNKTYRFGKILALDIFATTAALAIWFSVSKFFAKKREIKEVVSSQAASVSEAAGGGVIDADNYVEKSESKAHTSKLKHRSSQQPTGHQQRVEHRRAEEPATVHGF